MSTDFIGLFDLTAKEFSCESFIEHVSSSTAIASVAEVYRNLWIPKTWEVDVSNVKDTTRIVGPGGFSFRIRPKTVQMYHMMRFSTFTGKAESRQWLRLACRVIASYVGSARAIYTHELMPSEGTSLDQIEANLRLKIGPPASSYEELHVAEYFGPRAWYIDAFTDLSD